MLHLLSPAKINLFLRVLDKRSDGYHEVASLMQAIDLSDRLAFRLSDKDTLICNAPHFPLDEKNLILKAANLFRKKTGKKFGLHVEVEKRIPMEAGLGGGSSNAATTLWALNQLHQFPVMTEELQTWSSELGSDVPFFFSKGTAYCTGRGERVLEVEPLTSFLFWVVKPEFGLSTAEVYKRYQPYQSEMWQPERILESFKAGNPKYFNDLETPAFSCMPTLQTFKASLMEQGFSQVLMSGSGSSFFCFCEEFSKLRVEEVVTKLPFETKFYPVKYINRKHSGWYL